jgi:glycosyltransferase involved in cell wall biosynthesis
MRGAERTFAQIAACWPNAPIYTLLYDRNAMENALVGRDIHASYLQRLGIRQRSFRYLLPLFPRATERLPVDDCGVVISSSSAFAHGVHPAPGALHICYCHSPFRYAWFERDRAMTECPRLARPLMRHTLQRIRSWDRDAAKRVTRYVANSALTRDRIERFYGIEADVIHPPVAVERFSIGEPEDFALFVGQIVRHKRVEVAVEASRLAQRPIKVVGDGPDLPRLRQLYGSSNVEFLGNVTDAELADLYSRCSALLVPNVEEFGIAAVEAQAAGRPVIAINRGGVRETILDGETGLLVDGDDAASLAEPLRNEDFGRFDPSAIKAHAERFSANSFRNAFKTLVDRYAAEHEPPC